MSKQFSMSKFATAEDLYKAKAEYFEACAKEKDAEIAELRDELAGISILHDIAISQRDEALARIKVSQEQNPIAYITKSVGITPLLRWFSAKSFSAATLGSKLYTSSVIPPTEAELRAGIERLRENDVNQLLALKAADELVFNLRSELIIEHNRFQHELIEIGNMNLEIEKLRAELAVYQNMKPVAYLNLAVWRVAGHLSVFATPSRAFDNQDELFAHPPKEKTE